MTESLPDAIQRLLAEAKDNLDTRWLPEGSTVEFNDTPLTVTKATAHMIVSEHMLMDAGAIPDTRPPVHIPWRTRLRWRWRAWRERVGRKVGGWIGGVDLTERDGDW